MSINIASPNFKKLAKPMPQPMDMGETNSLKLLDEMAVAAQIQLIAPTSAIRQAWRQRMNDCRAELAKRVAAGVQA